MRPFAPPFAPPFPAAHDARHPVRRALLEFLDEVGDPKVVHGVQQRELGRDDQKRDDPGVQWRPRAAQHARRAHRAVAVYVARLQRAEVDLVDADCRAWNGRGNSSISI